LRPEISSSAAIAISSPTTRSWYFRDLKSRQEASLVSTSLKRTPNFFDTWNLLLCWKTFLNPKTRSWYCGHLKSSHLTRPPNLCPTSLTKDP
jgi:hypothetical protein